MDKFDEVIKNTVEEKQPSNEFVESTMKLIEKRHARKLKSWKVWLPILGGAVAAIAIILLVLPSSSPTKSLASDQPTNSHGSSKSTTSSPSSTTALAPGSDNASLTSDLNSIGGSINQENNDQNSANSGLNDSQQEITIPTD